MPGDDRQREHQANERTFLAWVRTSLSFLGIGLALARFSLFIRQGTNPDATVTNSLSSDITTFLGAAMVGIGITTIILGLWEYNRAYRQIEARTYQPNRPLVWFLAILILLLGLVSLPIALWRASANKPKQMPIKALPAPGLDDS